MRRRTEQIIIRCDGSTAKVAKLKGFQESIKTIFMLFLIVQALITFLLLCLKIFS